ncbi:unnamed protein product [Trichobilharzia regenti]|nr:unnamed protein product [Trichobilharzia regenti]
MCYELALDGDRANVIANMSATLPRGHRAQEANLAHSGLLRTASQREDFTEGRLAIESHTVSHHNLGGNNLGSGLIVNTNGGDGTLNGKRGVSIVVLFMSFYLWFVFVLFTVYNYVLYIYARRSA